MGKILADAAYEQVFREWVEENLLGVELEISSKPPGTEGFVPGGLEVGHGAGFRHVQLLPQAG
ncbi:hypothetical protein ACFSKU_04085 [Pontibacter silvestris]|uniref:Uncharacterized protein n=1 Tax=Pontibacter silvestris TaxID=2305183 RepID=A0ABW4WVN7_9BACT